MLKKSAVSEGLVTTVFLVAIFGSLILLPNDVSSKIIIVFFLLTFIIKKGKLNVKRLWNEFHPFLILFSILTLSLVYSQDLGLGLKKLQRLTILPVVALVFSNISISYKNFMFVVKSIIASTILACLYCHIIMIVNFLQSSDDNLRSLFNMNYSYKALSQPLEIHTAYFSMFILVSVLLLIYITPRNKNLTKKIISGVLISYLLLFTIQLSSRTGIIIMYLLLNFCILYYTKRKIRALLFILIFNLIAITAILNIGVTKYRFQHIVGFTYYTGYNVNDGRHKAQLWTAAFNANHNMILGNGLGDIQSSLNAEFRNRGLTKPLQLSYNSHNQYIEYYVGIGIVGLISFLYLLGFYFYRFYRNNCFTGIAFMVIVALFCLTECFFNRHHGVVFICVFLALFIISPNSRIRA